MKPKKNNARGLSRVTRLNRLRPLPLLVDAEDAMKVLSLTKAQLNGLVRTGKLDDCVLWGSDRQLFAKSQIRAIILEQA